MDPSLAQVVTSLQAAGHWFIAVDTRWHLVFVSDELQASGGAGAEFGDFVHAPAQVEARLRAPVGLNTIEAVREEFRYSVGWVLADTGLDHDALRDMVHPILRDLIDGVESCDDAARFAELPISVSGGSAILAEVVLRVRDPKGRVVGSVILHKPALGMSTIGALTVGGDIAHFDRIQRLGSAGRRPAAIMFADLEGSASLAKRLSTPNYFTLVRHLIRAADQVVIDAGGLVGRHAGDGVTSFFAAETAGSEAAAAAACVSASRALQVRVTEVAIRNDLRADEVVVRAGLHWGTTLYIGRIVTNGRSEVTALGDEVNEAARIEACASGGRILASKDLIERLQPDDATRLGLDLNRITYTQLADLKTATTKARRDAPSIAVCDIADNAREGQSAQPTGP
jgi:class 3 adenylate cyclase